MAENNSGSGPQNATTGTIRTQTSETVRPTASTPKLNLEAIKARYDNRACSPKHAMASACDVPALCAEVERLQKQHYDEVVDHAACMSIAEWAPIEGFVPTRASHRAVLAMRADNERLRAALRDALFAADEMGEELNAMDVAGEMENFERITAAMERARAALGEP